MERLTGKVTHCCYICKSARSKMKHRTGCNENCDVLKVYNRLNAYEDTGLEPKQVLKIANVFQQFGEEYNCWFNFVVDFVCKYAQAEQDGRLVVLPCKVGDTVWLISQVFNGKETVYMVERRVIDGIGGNRLNQIWMVSKEPYEMRFHPSEFSRTVFLTREEAEAALAEQAK